MKRSESRVVIVVGIVVTTLIFSGILGAHEIYRLTQNKMIFNIWCALCLIFQTPFIIIPLDRGRTIGFVGKYLPQWFSLFMVAWNLTQIFLLLLSPLIIFLPAENTFSEYFPVGVALIILCIVFRSAYRVVERVINLKVKTLPSDWVPLTILHLSDIHSGPFMRSSHLDKIVTRLNKKTFDLCVVTGDVVNHSAKELGWTLSSLEKINARLGTYASIGNHEYIDNEKEIEEGYKNSKIELLLDSSKLISSEKTKVRLIGVDFPFEKGITGAEEIKSALAKSINLSPVEKGELQVLLSHHPDGFQIAQTLGIPVTLSGHTHGGQIKFGKKSLANLMYKYVMGLYEQGGSFLYVSAGLGNWLPFRINVPCEYALITIEK
jgi:predicted MPP superfamily phosphohydrolase